MIHIIHSSDFTKLRYLFDYDVTEQALFHYNFFTGTMPTEICNLTFKSLKTLYADCLDMYQQPRPISCDCCTDCCDKTQNTCFQV